MAKRSGMTLREMMETPLNEFRAISVEDMCGLTGMTRQAIATLVATQQIPGQKLGTRYFFPPLQVMAWLRGEWTPPPILPKEDRKPIGISSIKELRDAG